MSQPTIANWERGGHIPRPDALSRIADVLGTDPTWLISGELPPQSNPAHQHLAKPIYHIPVYEWPLDMTDPRRTQPCRYMSVAADVTDMFALDANADCGFPDGSILIFSTATQTCPGQFLIRTGRTIDLQDRDSLSDDIFARLIYSVVPH